MSTEHPFWFKPLRWLQKQLVQTIVVPQAPFNDLNLDANKPLVYVMKTKSISDTIALNEITAKLNLPSPYASLLIKEDKFAQMVCLEGAKPLFGQRDRNEYYLDSFSKLLEAHHKYPELDVQLVPVSLYWGRTPGKEYDSIKAAMLERENPTWLRKFLMILFLGRHNFVQFSKVMSLRYMADEHGTDKRIAQKLARVARVHFRRQRKVITGPVLPNRNDLFRALLASKSVQKAIKEEAQNKKISTDKANQRAVDYLDEIAAQYSNNLIRIAERFLTWLWNKLYKGINIKGAEQIRQLHHDGHEIIYIPCHRSHMDYLLLSYILYYQGMVPPHIAAGINLNFWPAGPMFRRGGAFFIRRSFGGNKLYTAVFREYLDQLFTNGYSVEFFAEGGRSRTGRLLAPKTGMLAMTLNSVLRGVKRPVTLVPVYLGYDHVMEVATYHKELSGKKKKDESLWQVFRALRKLGNFGQGYVNFGQPITLHHFLNEQVPTWREQLARDPEQKPTWLTPAVNTLAKRVMTHVNDAAAVSSITLTSLVLLATEQRALQRTQLEQQLDLYLSLLKQLPYTEFSSVTKGDGAKLVTQGLELKKLQLNRDPLGDIIAIDDSIATAMTYYRNNIIHLLIIPSLIARCLTQYGRCKLEQIITTVEYFYPLLQAELFMGIADIPAYVTKHIELLIEREMITQDDGLSVNPEYLNQLVLLARTIGETMQRYAIIFNILATTPKISRAELERASHCVAKRLGALHGITAPEFYDKKLYGILSVKLKRMGYLSDDDKQQEVQHIRSLANRLLDTAIKQTIIDGVAEGQ